MQPQQNPYGFLNETPTKKSLFGNAPKKTVFLFVGGVAALLIVASVILFSLFGGGDPAEASLRTTLQRQLEIVRIASMEQVAEGTDLDIKNISANILLTLKSDNTKLTSAASGAGITFEEEQLLSPNSAATTAKIEGAVSAGTLNETTVEIFAAELEAYRAELTVTYEQATTKDIRSALEAAFTNTDLLVKQLEAAK